MIKECDQNLDGILDPKNSENGTNQTAVPLDISGTNNFGPQWGLIGSMSKFCADLFLLVEILIRTNYCTNILIWIHYDTTHCT